MYAASKQTPTVRVFHSREVAFPLFRRATEIRIRDENPYNSGVRATATGSELFCLSSHNHIYIFKYLFANRDD